MKKIISLGIIVVLASNSLWAMEKLYDIKSGKITYKIDGSGNVMGQTMQKRGKKRLIFDHYGTHSLTEKVVVDKQKIMGQENVTKTHTMTYFKEGIVYSVDFDTKEIYRTVNEGMVLMGGQGNLNQRGEAMMKKMGGKKTGTDKVLGYTCDVWELMGTKQCLYKGVPLKVESNMMGIINKEIAVEATFDVALSEKNFVLPDFPVYDEWGKKLDKSQLYVMDKRAIAENKEASKTMTDIVQAAGNALQQSGIDVNKKNMSAQEKQQMESAISNAIIAAMMPQIKQEVLSQEKAIRFAKSCFQDADTLGEAKACDKKLSAMLGEEADEEEEPLTKWDAQTKKETLQEIEQALKGVECAKKAQTVQEMQQCQ